VSSSTCAATPVVARRPAEVTGAVPAGRVGDGLHPPVQALRGDPGQGQRHEHADAKPGERAAADARDLPVDFRQRQGRPHERDRAVADGDGRVHRADAGRVAEPLRAAHPRCDRFLNLLTAEMVLERGQLTPIHVRIAEHAAVRRHERHSGRDEPPEPVRFGVEIRGDRPALDERPEQAGLVQQRGFDLGRHAAGDEPLDRPAGHRHREDRGGQDAHEDARAERHGAGRSSSL
jgi:hypothetical protein